VHLNHVRSGGGEPLLLMHGIGDTLAAWTPVREILSAHHEVIAVDLPGFGRSRMLGEPPTPQALARAVTAFMGGEPFHAVGNSLGGGIALELAKSGQALSATGLSPIGFARGWERAWLRAALELTHTVAPVLRLRAGARAASWLLMERPRPREVLERGIDDLALSPGWAATLPPTVAYEFTGAIEVPVTIAWGDRDKLLPPWQAWRARAALPAARHVTLRGCGHLPQWDDPEQVAEAILSATGARGRSAA
jgi:pimeloyl-ACP methyl ester carboxylesterase